MSGPRTLEDVALVDLHVRARAVRKLCGETDDLDMRWELVTAAFLTTRREPAPAVEDETRQLRLDVEAAV